MDFSTRNDAIFDLVISDEPHMDSELMNLCKFSGSDHNALTWKLLVNRVYESTERSLYNYRKAVFESIRREHTDTTVLRLCGICPGQPG